MNALPDGPGPQPAVSPRILLLDNQILVVLKPPGVLSQADGQDMPDMLTILKDELKVRFNKPGRVFLGLVHRLDQPVGGVMIFARTSKSASRLSDQIRRHQMAKYYLTVVHGRPTPLAGRLVDQLIKDETANRVRIAGEGEGRAAWLDYQVLETRGEPDSSLIAIRLGTGRAHQIRVQLAARGWPIFGDRKYNPGGREADLALFACCLGFFHPVSREWLTVAALPPAAHPWTLFQPVDVESVPQLFMV
jgi:23S rRNA pseudouridine1911/1915/1917 synthase